MCKEAGVYFVTQWNKPDDLHPWDYDPYWVCHMGVDGVPSGYYVAKELFEAMGGKGKIVALQGLLANVPAIQRFDGLQEGPGRVSRISSCWPTRPRSGTAPRLSV